MVAAVRRDSDSGLKAAAADGGGSAATLRASCGGWVVVDRSSRSGEPVSYECCADFSNNNHLNFTKGNRREKPAL